MTYDRKVLFAEASRIVVKIGSGIITHDNGLNIDVIRSVGGQVSALIDRGLEVLLVSSGAMAAGAKKIGIKKRPDEIPKRQAIAAVGQAGLILEYEKAFARHGRKVAQILLTSDGLTSRKRYLNARNTLNTLLNWGIVPVINENDTISIDEIKFGDNDTLSAMIALLMDADILINLTDIDGLFNTDPRRDPNARLLSEIPAVTRDIHKIAGETPGALGTGGMRTKIKAAEKVGAAGVPMIIARGSRPNVLLDLFDGVKLGTFFAPAREKLANRKRWIAFSLKPKGSIFIDDGAANAIMHNGKSLLPIGIIGLEGEFGVGAPVEFKNRNCSIGMGLVNYGSADIRKIMGIQTSKIVETLGEKPYDEVIHRDNLAVTGEIDE